MIFGCRICGVFLTHASAFPAIRPGDFSGLSFPGPCLEWETAVYLAKLYRPSRRSHNCWHFIWTSHFPRLMGFLPRSRLSIFGSHVDICRLGGGGIFSREMPLGAQVSVKNRIKNVLAPPAANSLCLTARCFAVNRRRCQLWLSQLKARQSSWA